MKKIFGLKTLYLPLAIILLLVCIPQNVCNTEASMEIPPPEVTIVEENETGITLKVDFFGFYSSQTEEDGWILDVLSIPGCGLAGEVGRPALSRYGTALVVPFGVDFNIYVLDTVYEETLTWTMYPGQDPGEDVIAEFAPPFPTPPFYIDEEFYGTFDDLYPEMIVEYGPVGTLRDVRVLPLGFIAFQNNPVQGILRFYSSITVRVDYITGPLLSVEKELSTRVEPSPYFKGFYSSILGFEQLLGRGMVGQDGIIEPQNDLGYDFLIITDPSLVSAANTLAARRNAQGISTFVVDTTTTGSTATDIKAYIQNAYDTWDTRPSYLLLLGDSELIPTFYQSVHPSGWYPANFRTGTDLYYVIMNGPEGAPPYYSEYWTPDIFHGRIPVDTLTEAETVVNKIIGYEDDQWRAGENSTLVAGYFQDHDDPPDGFEDRRFILTSEEIRDFLVGEGFDVERLYVTLPAVNPTNYNPGTYDAGLPIPAELLRPTYPWNAGTTDIVNAIDDGRFVVFHRDHGGSLNRPSSPVEGWGDPEFEDADVASLNNPDHYPVVFSINCETGWFDGETDDYPNWSYESLVEAFLREDDRGAVGVFGATRISYSGWNDDLAKGFLDAIWPNFDGAHGPGTPQLTMGEVLNYGKWYMYTVGAWPTNRKLVEYEIFHYYGDPTMAFKIPEEIHDVEAVSQHPTQPTAIQGDVVPVVVEVRNNGGVPETFDVTAWADGIVIGTKTVTNLPAGWNEVLTYDWNTAGVPGATYNIYAKADSADAIVEVDEVNNDCTSLATIRIMVPPNADADGPYEGYEGSPITFDASGSTDPDGNIVLYEWDFDMDTVIDYSGPLDTVDHTYGDDYFSPAWLRVTDDDGLTDEALANVNVKNVAPTVDAGPDQESLPGHQYTEFCFEGSFTDPGWLDTHTAEWDFGDGTPRVPGSVVEENVAPDSTGTVNGICHQYWVPYQDEYTVTLIVYDDDGLRNFDTLTVTILRVIGGEELPLDVGTVLTSMLYSYWWIPTLVAMVLAVVYFKRRWS